MEFIHHATLLLHIHHYLNGFNLESTSTSSFHLFTQYYIRDIIHALLLWWISGLPSISYLYVDNFLSRCASIHLNISRCASMHLNTCINMLCVSTTRKINNLHIACQFKSFHSCSPQRNNHISFYHIIKASFLIYSFSRLHQLFPRNGVYPPEASIQTK